VAPAKTYAHRLSLRDAQKDKTRRALRDAAYTLFATRGYDATTTDEIAEKAGVSSRTFFRHYPTKEHVVYYGERDWIQDFVDIYSKQPATLSDLEATRVTLLDLAPRSAKSRAALSLYQRAVDSSPTLRGREQDHFDDSVATLSRAVARRRGRRRADEACVLFASIVLLTYRRAVSIWLAGPSNVSLARVITNEFKLLDVQFRE
jgi:AcrR family transcriptional regulator